jgi:hypothetical protein
MITFPQSTPHTYKKETYKELESRLLREYDYEKLGTASDEKSCIYGLKYGDMENKPVILLSACIHGEEWESTYWTLHFFDCVIDPEKAEPPVRHFFETLRIRYSFYCIPVINPFGFEHSRRLSKDEVDLNRVYHKDKYAEVEIVKKRIAELKPVLVADNHTAEMPKETIGVGGLGNKNIVFLGESIIKSMKFIRGHNQIEWYREPVQENVNIGRGWISGQPSKSRHSVFSVIVEAAREAPLGSLQSKAEFGFNAILCTCLYTDLFFRRGILGGTGKQVL